MKRLPSSVDLALSAPCKARWDSGAEEETIHSPRPARLGQDMFPLLVD